ADNGYTEGDNLVLDVQIGSGDVNNLSTIADQLINEKNDLILAIATPSAQAVAGKTNDIPILGTAITDYTVAGLAESNEKPGHNISGTTDMNPINEQLDLLIKLVPDVKTVGFVYSSNEDNSRLQIELAKAYLDGKGIAYKEVTIANSNDVQQAVTSLVDQVDAFYLPTDNVLASTMPTVNSITVEKKIPVICAEQGMVENGGLATLGISYYDLGYETGLMAIKVFEGADISTLPIEASKNFEYYINADVVSALGITVPEDLKQYVK
ncbi:MAG: ABC transporter substrate-binding protein, partial [Coriobacteriales bacterium]|nr:ABC transporter substrate-binding protein [Coriobacteriales bacterium]